MRSGECLMPLGLARRAEFWLPGFRWNIHDNPLPARDATEWLFHHLSQVQICKSWPMFAFQHRGHVSLRPVEEGGDWLILDNQA